jgi:hypothetical protein
VGSASKILQLSACVNGRVRPLFLRPNMLALLPFRDGSDVVAVSERLGHWSPSLTLAVYAHAIRGGQWELALAIGAALNRGEEWGRDRSPFTGTIRHLVWLPYRDDSLDPDRRVRRTAVSFASRFHVRGDGVQLRCGSEGCAARFPIAAETMNRYGAAAVEESEYENAILT